MRLLAVLLGGLVFGAGLAWSTMARPEVVLSFLHLADFGLLLVMGGGIAVTALAFALAPRLRGRPLFTASFDAADARLDRRTAIGAIVFGVGWGISGACPGAALASLGIGNAPILVAIAGMFVGAWLQGRLLPDGD